MRSAAPFLDGNGLERAAAAGASQAAAGVAVGFIRVFVERAAALVRKVAAAGRVRAGRAVRRATAFTQIFVGSAALRADKALIGRAAALTGRGVVGAGAIGRQRFAALVGRSLAARALAAEIGALAQRCSRARIAVIAA